VVKKENFCSLLVLPVIPYSNQPKGGAIVSKNKVIKSVSFNVTNEEDQRYLERIENVNFSGYVKRLIEKDIRQRKVIKSAGESVTAPASHTAIVTKGTTLTLKS
jgi:hypothetical protein